MHGTEMSKNVEWLVGRAEELEIKQGSCDLIASASAFHWMDRKLLAKRAFQGLKPGAALALIGGGGGGGVRKGDAEWHGLVTDCLRRHVPEQPPPKGGQKAGARKNHADFLVPAGFRVENFNYPTDYSWRVDEVISYLYSISFPPLAILGDGREAFERDLRESLSRVNSSGIFHQRLDFFLTIAYKP
jgi:hypothetical protein